MDPAPNFEAFLDFLHTFLTEVDFRNDLNTILIQEIQKKFRKMNFCICISKALWLILNLLYNEFILNRCEGFYVVIRPIVRCFRPIFMVVKTQKRNIYHTVLLLLYNVRLPI